MVASRYGLSLTATTLAAYRQPYGKSANVQATAGSQLAHCSPSDEAGDDNHACLRSAQSHRGRDLSGSSVAVYVRCPRRQLHPEVAPGGTSATDLSPSLDHVRRGTNEVGEQMKTPRCWRLISIPAPQQAASMSPSRASVHAAASEVWLNPHHADRVADENRGRLRVSDRTAAPRVLT